MRGGRNSEVCISVCKCGIKGFSQHKGRAGSYWPKGFTNRLHPYYAFPYFKKKKNTSRHSGLDRSDQDKEFSESWKAISVLFSICRLNCESLIEQENNLKITGEHSSENTRVHCLLVLLSVHTVRHLPQIFKHRQQLWNLILINFHSLGFSQQASACQKGRRHREKTNNESAFL